MDALEVAWATPIGRVRLAWNGTLGLSLIIVICAIAAAAANDADPRGNKGAGFASVWCIFVLCLVGVNGAWLDREVDRDRARAAARVPVLIRTCRARATVSCPVSSCMCTPRARPRCAPPGSVVLLKTRSALMIGVLLGSAVMMSQMCFSERSRARAPSARRAPLGTGAGRCKPRGTCNAT